MASPERILAPAVYAFYGGTDKQVTIPLGFVDHIAVVEVTDEQERKSIVEYLLLQADHHKDTEERKYTASSCIRALARCIEEGQHHWESFTLDPEDVDDDD